MAWRQTITNARAAVSRSNPGFLRFFSKSPPYIVKVGIPEFLNGIGKGVETYVAKLESEIGDFQKLLVTRTLKLKKLGIACQHEIAKPRILQGPLFYSCGSAYNDVNRILMFRTKLKYIAVT